MNKKQMIVLWAALILIALIGIFPPQYCWITVGTFERGQRKLRPMRPSRPTRPLRPTRLSRIQRGSRLNTESGSKTDMGKLIGYWIAIGSVAGGFIYILRDKKNKEDKTE